MPRTISKAEFTGRYIPINLSADQTQFVKLAHGKSIRLNSKQLYPSEKEYSNLFIQIQ